MAAVWSTSDWVIKTCVHQCIIAVPLFTSTTSRSTKQPELIILISNKPVRSEFNPLNAELNPICHLLALLEVHHILHVSRIRVHIGN